jgi:MarR family transcriptional regulator, organic hydroperoxide resistance regulator
MSQEPRELGDQSAHPASALQRGDQVRSITHSLRIVVRAIQDYSRHVESQCSLKSSQLWTLWELFTTPGMKVSELAAALYIHQSTASNMLDKLEGKGLVERRRGGPDQRIVRLYLSEAGVALLAVAPRPAQGALTAALQELPDASLQCLAAGLNDLVAGLKFKDPKAALKPLPED